MYPNHFDKTTQWSVSHIKAKLKNLKENGIESVLPIELHLDAPEEVLPGLFEKCTYAFNPAYRGMTLRNSSMSSALANGFVLFSHIDRITPATLRPDGQLSECAVLSTTDSYHTYADWVLAQIKSRTTNPELNQLTSNMALAAARQHLSLDLITQKHSDIYTLVAHGAASKVLQRAFRAKRAYAYTEKVLGRPYFSTAKKRKISPLHGLTDLEQQLQTLLLNFPWTLKHATFNYPLIRDQGGNQLRSVKDRQRSDPSLSSDHTSACLGLDDYVYFTLGGPNHEIAGFLNESATDVVRIKLSDLEQNQRRHLLFGSHIYEFSTNNTYRLNFDGTERIESFHCSDDLDYGPEKLASSHVRYTYKRADGSRVERQTTWDNLNSIGDNIIPFLVRYVIEELRYIGGNYQSYVLSNLDNQWVIERLVNTLLHSHTFEARMPCSFDLSQPGVRVESLKDKKAPLTSDQISLFKAAESGDIPSLTRLLAAGVNVRITNQDDRNPLMAAILNSQGSAANLLFRHDPSLLHNNNDAVLCAASRNLWNLVSVMIDTSYPISSDHKIQKYYEIESCNMFSGPILSKLLSSNNHDGNLLKKLHALGAHLTHSMVINAIIDDYPLLNLIYDLYPDARNYTPTQQELDSHLLQDFSRYYRPTDDELWKKRRLLELGANPNTMPHAFPRDIAKHSEPLIFQAVRKGRGEIVQLLIEFGAELTQLNFFGQTALDVAKEKNLRNMTQLLQSHGAQNSTKQIQKFCYFDHRIHLKIMRTDTTGQEYILLGNPIVDKEIQPAYAFPIWSEGVQPRRCPLSMEEVISQWLKNQHHLDIPPTQMSALYHHQTIDTPLPKTETDEFVEHISKAHHVWMIHLQMTGDQTPSVTNDLTNLRWVKVSDIPNYPLSFETGLFAELNTPPSPELSDRWNTLFDRRFDGGNLYHLAIVHNNIPELLRLINDGYDIESRSSLGLTPLVLAVRENNDSIVDILLANGVNIESWTKKHHNCSSPKWNVTPFLMAIESNNRSMAIKLFNAGAHISPETKDPYIKPSVQLAYDNENYKFVMWLLNNGAPLPSDSALFDMIGDAVSDEHYQILKVLIHKREAVDIFSQMYPKHTPLSWCLEGDHSEKHQKRFRFLLQNRADPYCCAPSSHLNTIQYAQLTNCQWALNILREFGHTVESTA